MKLQPAGTKRARKTSFSDEAYEVAKERLITGQCAPDTYIDDRALAEELNVSRTPVREALIRLSNEGMVEFVPRRGIRVLPTTLDVLAESFDVITAMEFMAVDLIVESDDRDEILKELERCVAQLQKIKPARNIERWIDCDEVFHRTLLVRCGNNEVMRIGLNLRDKTHRVLRVAKRLWSFADQACTAHTALIEAIRSQDGAAARRVQYRYRRAKEREMLECLGQTGVKQF